MEWILILLVINGFLALLVGFRILTLNMSNSFLSILAVFVIIQSIYAFIEFEINTTDQVELVNALLPWHNAAPLLASYFYIWLIWTFATESNPLRPLFNWILFGVTTSITLLFLYGNITQPNLFKYGITQNEEGYWIYFINKKDLLAKLWVYWLLFAMVISCCISLFWAYFNTYNKREKALKGAILLYYIVLMLILLFRMIILVDPDQPQLFRRSLAMAPLYIPILLIYIALRQFKITPSNASFHIMDTIPHPVLQLDEQLHVKYHNRAVNKAVGAPIAAYFKDAPMRKVASIFGLYSNWINEQKDKILQLQPGEKIVMELPVKSPEKEQFYHLVITPIFWFNRILTGFVLLATDLTKPHKNAQELARYAKELEQANEKFSHFAQIASADLKNPIRSIISFSGLLQHKTQHLKDEVLNEYLAFISENAALMYQMVEDIMVFSKIEQQTTNWMTIDLNAVYQQTLEMLEEKISTKNVQITSAPLPAIRSSFPLMLQLFTNLIENGIKYNESPHIRVKINYQQTGEWHILHFSDNGIGINPAFQKQIFEIFRRLHNHEKYSGTGIGLAICKKITALHHGKITIQSEPGKGSTFQVFLHVDKVTL